MTICLPQALVKVVTDRATTPVQLPLPWRLSNREVVRKALIRSSSSFARPPYNVNEVVAVVRVLKNKPTREASARGCLEGVRCLAGCVVVAGDRFRYCIVFYCRLNIFVALHLVYSEKVVQFGWVMYVSQYVRRPRARRGVIAAAVGYWISIVACGAVGPGVLRAHTL